MEFIRRDGSLFAQIDNPRSTALGASQLHELGEIDNPFLDELLSAVRRRLVGCAYATQRNVVCNGLRPFGVYLNYWIANRSVKRAPADSDAWQAFVCDFSLWWLVRNDSKAALTTRCMSWDKTVSPLLEYLQEEEVLPLGLIVPKLKLPKEKTSFNPQQPKLIGESPATDVPETHTIEKAPIDRTLAGPIFWRCDAAYLDEIENTLRRRDSLLASTLDDHWLRLVKDYRAGRRLQRQITETEWLTREEAGNWTYGYSGRLGYHIDRSRGGVRIPLCSPQNPRGHAWLIRFLQHFMLGLDDVENFNIKEIQAHPAIGSACFQSSPQTPIEPLKQLTSLTQEQLDVIPIIPFVWRFLGLLSLLDMTVAMAILIREHPTWTPEALAGAKLLNSRGKSYLLMTDSADQNAIFSIDKRRAGSRKYATLSKRSARVVRHILRATAPVRGLLKQSGHPHNRYLLLGYMRNKGLGHPTSIPSRMLSGSSNITTLAHFYPELLKHGLCEGTLDFAKIRATQGVLAWFDKGSVKAVHQRLGNSYRVSIQHYIPEPLLAAWNERIIRRFQNCLLVIAASEEEYLLNVVDMSSLAELHGFLAQLVYEMPSDRSPIASRIHKIFSEHQRSEHIEGDDSVLKKQQLKESLHIRLNPNCIALLLAYRQWANSQLTPEMQNREDHQTGLSPKHFIDLAGMLQAVVQNDQVGKDISRSLDLRNLKRQFWEAEPKVADLVMQLHSKSLIFKGEVHERWG